MKKKIIIIFSIICMLVIILFIMFNFILYPTKHKNYVLIYAEKYNIDVSLIYAIIKTESNFDAKAVSPSNARGLMQIIPSTAKWIASELNIDYNDEILFNSETNINFGCFYIDYLFKKFNDMDIVICAYNAGETIVKTWLDENGKLDESKINYKETENYLKKVRSYYNIYKNKQIIT